MLFILQFLRFALTGRRSVFVRSRSRKKKKKKKKEKEGAPKSKKIDSDNSDSDGRRLIALFNVSMPFNANARSNVRVLSNVLSNVRKRYHQGNPVRS